MYRPPCAVCRGRLSSFQEDDVGPLCSACYARHVMDGRVVVLCPSCGADVPSSLLILHASCRGDPGHVVLHVMEA